MFLVLFHDDDKGVTGVGAQTPLRLAVLICFIISEIS
jgi:hypothetical protein